MHLNMLLLPMIGLGSDSSWSLIAGFFSWRKVSRTFLFGNSASFYITMQLQQMSLGFQYVLVRITDLINFLFSIKAVNKFYTGISEKPWLKFECDTFDYGYYYAMYTTMINGAICFG